MLFNKLPRYKLVHSFRESICPKVNTIARQEFELASYNGAVLQVKHYTTGTNFSLFCISLSLFISLSLSLYIYIYIYVCVCVIYWPSTEPSINRCTCVNKRKNSGSRWTIDNNITRCADGLSQLETECWSENQLQTEGFGPLVTPGWATPAKMRKKCCFGRGRTWVNIAVLPCLHSFLTHKKHYLFENKVREIYIKKSIRSSVEVVIIFDYGCEYTTYR